MLDKTLPYIEFEMKFNKSIAPTSIPRELPAGFQLKEYQPGDEASWCAVEYAVGDWTRWQKLQLILPKPSPLSRRAVPAHGLYHG